MDVEVGLISQARSFTLDITNRLSALDKHRVRVTISLKLSLKSTALHHHLYLFVAHHKGIYFKQLVMRKHLNHFSSVASVQFIIYELELHQIHEAIPTLSAFKIRGPAAGTPPYVALKTGPRRQKVRTLDGLHSPRVRGEARMLELGLFPAFPSGHVVRGLQFLNWKLLLDFFFSSLTITPSFQVLSVTDQFIVLRCE